ncbi:serine/threonine-protein kinase [uncultured Paludibaculum sp.]|uniref:serine/threonine-protein kinase n=1 Tax=uncultured Paludibaculum sp. TaxID=1765020 RepID=UPI002AAA70CD|nr:serine/threonine-protein kinase [uncultured Paludibaculum sp.]
MDRFARLETLFHKARGLPRDEWDLYLAREANDDPPLQDEVRELLRANGSAGGPIETQDGMAALVAAGAAVLTQFGAYRVMRLLGRGGMGAVYLAERADGEYTQNVALKVLAPHLADDAFATRFRTERQLLAQMNHPNIVRLLDGGVSASGEPYLVTEYIDGEPLDTYCDRLRLDVRARLRLFLDVCDAVAHAHRNLVIHRDLKPANILVDKTGTVKLLDFGTATLIGSRESSAVTTLPLLTPRYASPEQLRNDPLNIATDVYSLGLILHELLGGHRPFAISNDLVQEFARATQDMPVAALGSAATAQAAGARGVSLNELKSELSGDLNAIAAKAVAYTLRERYQSVEELRDDVTAFLESRPVHARPLTITYRARKFLYRRRYVVAAVVAVLVASTAGVVATVQQKRLAEQRFEEVRRLAHYQMFELYDRAELIPGTLRMRAEMVQRSLDYLDRLAAQKDLNEGLAVEIAQGYRRLGDTQGNFAKATLGNPALAARMYEKGLVVLRPLVNKSEAARRAQQALEASAAIAELSTNPAAGSLPKLESIIAALEKQVAANPADEDGRLLLGRAMIAIFSSPEARDRTQDVTADIARKSEAVLAEGADRHGPRLASFQLALLDLYRLRASAIADRNPAESRQWLERGLRLLRGLPPELQNSSIARKARASYLMTLSAAAHAEGDAQQALAMMEEPLVIVRELARDPDDLQACANLAVMLENRALMRWNVDDFQGYLADYSESTPLNERLVKSSAGERFRLYYLSSLRNLAYAHDKLKTPQAPAMIHKAYEELKKAANDDSLGFRPKADLADLLLNLGIDGKARPDEALPYAQAAARLEPGALNSWESVAEASRQLGRFNEALDAINRAIGLLDAPKEGEAPTQFYKSMLTKRQQIQTEQAAAGLKP